MIRDFLNRVRHWFDALNGQDSMRWLAWYLLTGIPLAIFYSVFFNAYEVSTINTLKATGSRATATVIDHRTHEGGEETGYSRSYYITYVFAAPDNQQYEREQKVFENTYTAMGVGANVEIMYDPNNPTESRLSNSDSEPIEYRSYDLSVCGAMVLSFVLFPVIASQLTQKISEWKKGRGHDRAPIH